MHLGNIKTDKEIKSLSLEEVETLATEVRTLISRVTKTNGGHLASSLGTVELCCALLRVFDSEKDRIIFDVGHQSYAHKILTGRVEQFENVRQKDGISGFPKMAESACDAFNTGHASTSISAGMGMAVARDLKGEDHKVICVIGDGSISGGMSFEALNNLSEYKGQFLIVLNDNGMSISKNVGGLSKYLSSIRASKKARSAKAKFKSFLLRLPKGENLKLKLAKAKNKFFIKYTDGKLFELMGIDYYGAIDGHNMGEMEKFLRTLSEIKNPCILHVKTTKGKGDKNAEEDPEKFHGMSGVSKSKYKSFSQIAGEKLTQMADENKKIVAVSAGMVEGTGLSVFEKAHKDRLFDVGICEEHATTFCAGMAAGGISPYLFLYSSFLQRGFDQIYHDIILPQLPVTLMIDRCGLVGEDGETHHGVLDLNFLLSCGGIDIINPKDGAELAKAMDFSLSHNKPLAIRYPRGAEFDFSHCESSDFEYGKWEYLHRENSNTAVICAGQACLQNAVMAYGEAEKKFSVINARFISPLDTEMLEGLETKNIIVVSDSNKTGGFGSVVEDFYSKRGINANIKKLEITKVLECATIKQQQQEAGISAEDIKRAVEEYET